jgi:hypothetical protein
VLEMVIVVDIFVCVWKLYEMCEMCVELQEYIQVKLRRVWDQRMIEEMGTCWREVSSEREVLAPVVAMWAKK